MHISYHSLELIILAVGIELQWLGDIYWADNECLHNRRKTRPTFYINVIFMNQASKHRLRSWKCDYTVSWWKWMKCEKNLDFCTSVRKVCLHQLPWWLQANDSTKLEPSSHISYLSIKKWHQLILLFPKCFSNLMHFNNVPLRNCPVAVPG